MCVQYFVVVCFFLGAMIDKLDILTQLKEEEPTKTTKKQRRKTRLMTKLNEWNVDIFLVVFRLFLSFCLIIWIVSSSDSIVLFLSQFLMGLLCASPDDMKTSLSWWHSKQNKLNNFASFKIFAIYVSIHKRYERLCL